MVANKNALVSICTFSLNGVSKSTEHVIDNYSVRCISVHIVHVLKYMDSNFGIGQSVGFMMGRHTQLGFAELLYSVQAIPCRKVKDENIWIPDSFDAIN